MSKCTNCGYYWADLDEDGAPLSFEYCHFEGPDGWAPCEQDDYEEPEPYPWEELDFGNELYEEGELNG